MPSSILKKLLVAALLLLLALGVAAAFGWQRFTTWLDQPITSLTEPVDILVEPGSSVTRVVHQLANQGLLQQPRLLVYYLRATDQLSLLAGEYQLPVGITPRQLLAKLATGDVKYYEVTVVEGWTIKQALAQLHQQEALAQTIAPDSLDELLRRLDPQAQYPSPEGLFFPDTYRYVRGMSDAELLTRAYQIMQQTLADAWPAREENLPLASPYEALVLASIVEKETAVDSEREEIAGVFTSRLRKGMRLQTDPTVIYALGDSYQGNIRRKDLQVDSPFNTYRVTGLPPTPIALPSKRSIEAALHPAKTGNLYFVARGDGSHQFSPTLEAHNKAVQEYQVRNRVKNYRSVPSSNGGKADD
jgi:UPF0755 protein